MILIFLVGCMFYHGNSFLFHNKLFILSPKSRVNTPSNSRILEIFHGGGRATKNTQKVQNEICEYIESSISNLTLTDVYDIFYTAAKVKFPLPSAMLSILSEKIQSENGKIKFPHKLFFGLRVLSSDDESTKKLLRIIVDKCDSSIEISNINQFSEISYGLQGLKSQHKEVKALLHMLTSCLKNSSLYKNIHNENGNKKMFPISHREIGCTLYGLKNFNSVDKEVLDYIQHLNSVINNCNVTFDGQAISNCLYGLKECSTNQIEVCQLLDTIHRKICENIYANNCIYMTPLEISNALYGMNKMSSSSACARDMLYTVRHQIVQNKDQFNTRDISNALYGLNKMSNKYRETREILLSLYPKIVTLNGTFLPYEASNALYGLRSMHHKYDVGSVLLVLKALRPHIERSSGTFGPRDISTALYGLQGMASNDTEVLRILTVIHNKLTTGTIDFFNFATSIYALRNMNCNDYEVKRLLNILNIKMNISNETKYNENGQTVSNSLYAIQNWDITTSLEVRKIVSTICYVIDNNMNTPVLNEQGLSNAIFSLKGSSLNVPYIVTLGSNKKKSSSNTTIFEMKEIEGNEVVLRLVDVLTSLIETSTCKFGSQAIGNSMLALQGLNIRYDGVRRLLDGLCPKIEHAKESLNSHGIGNAFFGLQNMMKNNEVDIFPKELLRVISALTVHIRTSVEHLRSDDIQKILNSINGMISEGHTGSKYHCPNEIFEVLHAVGQKISQNNQLLYPEQFCSILSCMKGFNSSMLQVKYFLRSLLMKMAQDMTVITLASNNVPLFSGSLIMGALSGLQHMDAEDDEVGRILIWIRNNLHECTDPIPKHLVVSSLDSLGNMMEATIRKENDNFRRRGVIEIRSLYNEIRRKAIELSSNSML